MAGSGLRFRDGFRDDIKTLVPNGQKVALQLLIDIRKGEVKGAPLSDQQETGDLADCFKVYFDHDPDFQKPSDMRFQLVYRLLEDGSVVGLVVEAVAVGRRMNKEAYLRALANLGRTWRIHRQQVSTAVPWWRFLRMLRTPKPVPTTSRAYSKIPEAFGD